VALFFQAVCVVSNDSHRQQRGLRKISTEHFLLAA